MSDWAEFDAWEARDRTLLEAANERARRLLLLMGDDLDEPAATLALEHAYAGQLTLDPAARYAPPSPDEEQ